MKKTWKEAIETADLAAIAGLVEQEGNLDSRDEHGQTALMLASRAGSIDTVRLLVRRGASLDVTAKYGLTALMLAVVNDHNEVACELIRAGADVEKLGSGAPGFAGRTALDLARERRQDEVVRLLEGTSRTHRSQ